MEEHVYLCQRTEVAERVQSLGYTARTWNVNLNPERYAGRSIILVPDMGDRNGALDAALITELATEAGAASVRILKYPEASYTFQGFNLSSEALPHDLLARRILDGAAEQAPIRPRLPDILDLSIAKQFRGDPPEQRWLIGAPAGHGGLLPDAAPILLAGRGGIGKTHAATELALLVGTWDGQQPAPRWMGQPIRKAGPSVVITYEETRATMHRKVHMLCAHHGVPLEQGDRTIVISMIDGGSTGEPLIAPHPKTRALTATGECARLTKELRRLREGHGPLGVIVLDHVLRTFPIEGNSASDVNSAMALVGRWAAEFACPVIALAHTKKVVMTRDMGDEEILEAVLGSTGWVSAVRATMVMW